MAEAFSLKDQLFNADTLGDLAAEYAAGLPGFDASGFHSEVIAGLHARGLLERLEWIADCLEPRLASDFPSMADQLEAAMPPPLDASLKDDDFGRFIHAVPGILAVRHGLEAHRERALDLLGQATRRFSMEFYIRPFLNRWPNETMVQLRQWAEDENYHVRRLVSEGTRPKLPWAKAITLPPADALPLLDKLHGDATRYVTRSVANHLNDVAKIAPELVIDCLVRWRERGEQTEKELNWMTRHALRTLVKQGHQEALELLGYARDAPVELRHFGLARDRLRIGEALELEVKLAAPQNTPVLVDYLIRFHRPSGRSAQKVYKLRQGVIAAGSELGLSKRHVLKGNASTFTLHPGHHELALQVNGKIIGELVFELLPAGNG